MVEEVERAIGVAYGRLVAAVALVRNLHETYLDDLRHDHERQTVELEGRLAGRQKAVHEAHEVRITGLSAARANADNDFATQIETIIASNPWTAAAFAHPIWASYQP